MPRAWQRSSLSQGHSCRRQQRPKPPSSVSHILIPAGAVPNEMRLVRTLLNYFNDIPNSRQVQIDVLMDNIDWSKREKRIFLKHSLEIRLVAL